MMATHHWIIICGIKHHVQVGDYSGVRDEEGDEDGDVDEDDHRGDDSRGGTPAPARERGESLPLVLPPPWPPLDGERFSLWSLASMAMMAPLGSSPHGLR